MTPVAAHAACGTAYTVAPGSSFSFDSTLCDPLGTLGPGFLAVAPTHGTVTQDSNDQIVTYQNTPGDPATTDNFTWKDADNVAHPVTVTIGAGGATPVTLSPTSAPNGSVGTAYSLQFTASGGSGTGYTYNITQGNLPAGLNSNTAGLISGTPTESGTFTFTEAATDSVGGAGSQNITLTINGGPITVSPASGSLPNAVAYQGYTTSLTASSGTGPYTYSQVSGTAPPTGISIGSSGTISGTATALGTTNFSVKVADSAGASTQVNYTLQVVAPTITLTPATLPGGTQNNAYTPLNLSASGGTGPYSYTYTGTLPTGMSLSSAGVLSGTPTVAGNFPISVQATDAHSFTGLKPYTLVINAITAPGAPTIGTATAGNAQASVTFTAPASNGGAAIIGYTAISSPGGLTGTCASSPCTVTGLTNGTAYTFTVTATNSVGTGAASAASNSVTPQGSQTITFANPGAQNFGTTPTLTATATSGLTVTFSSTTTSVCTVTSGGLLTFITMGSCTISADQAGNGAYTAAPTVQQTFAVSPVVPGAPIIGTATAGDTQASVSFTAPAFTGGATITSYTAISSPGGLTATCASSPCIVTGLTDGTAYTFTVTATSSAGTGAPSAASNSVTPRAAQTITFANPGPQNFGTTPTLTATATSGLTVSFTSSTTSICTITTGGALTTVSAGTCIINANQAGNGTYLAASQVSQSFAIGAVVPGAPTVGTATAGDTQASVSFTAPGFTGGASITSYTATSSPGGLTATCAASPCVVTGLVNGTAYTFTVTATNSVGTGAPSAASNAVTPKGSQTITFANPGTQNFGTTPTLTATATSGLTVSFTSSTSSVCTITMGGALTTVSTGTCTINANQAGNGTYLAAPQVSQSFSIGAVVPGAPTVGTATGGDAQASVSFTAPAFTGGGSITSYTATSSPGGFVGTCASSPCTVAGLVNGTAYTFTVTATNAAGTGAPSAASNAVTPKASQTITFANPGPQNFGTSPTLTATASSGLPVVFSSSTTGVCTITSGGALTIVTPGTCTINVNQAGNGVYQAAAQVSQSFAIAGATPGAPIIGTATAGNAQVTVAFTPPASNGGNAITAYTATSSPGGITGTCAASPCTVAGLTNGTAYTFTVTATNAVGMGVASAASNSATPMATQAITFGNPGTQNFGTSPTLTATASSGLPVTFTSSTTTVCTITTGGALTTVTPGTCTINANQAGNGTYAAAPQVSLSFTIAGTAPGAPTIGTATAGNATANVTFTPPASNGGNAITGFTATSSPGGITGTCTSSPCAVAGLVNGTAYTFTVTATNATGTSVASAASNSVTPVANQVITFNNPGTQNFGTSPTLVATASSGLPVAFTSITTNVCTVTSGGVLTTVTPGTCTIHVNQAGNAAYTAALQVSQSFAIAGVAPGAPGIGTATAGDGVATVTFTAPSSNGGDAITGYTATSSPGGITGACSGSPCTLTGLSNGTAYTFTVTASNPAGTSAASVASNSVTPKAVGAITQFAANPAQPVFKPSGTFALSATGNGSSSPVVFAIASSSASVCSIQGATVTTLSAGVCIVTASQAGDAGHLAAAQLSLAVTINNPPPPVAGNVSANANYNTATAINLGSAISGIDVTSVAIANAPAHGTVTLAGQTVTYTPSSTFYGGTDSFTYTATNPGGTSVPGTVTVTVSALAVPTAVAHSVATTSGTPVVVQAETGATGPQPFTGLSVATQPAHGSTAVSGTQITYTPANGFVGTDTFTYAVSNNFGSSQPATITVTVTPAGSASGNTKTVLTMPGTPVSVDLASIVPGTYISSALVGLSPGNAGNVSLGQPTALTFTSSGNFLGLVQITAVLTPSSGAPVTVDVLVLVTKQPDPSKNADVLGIINAQTTQAQIFAQSQLNNIRGRLEGLHDGSGSLFSNTLSLSVDGHPLQGGGPNAMPNARWPVNGMMRPGIGASDAMAEELASSDATGSKPAQTTAKGPQGLGIWVGGSANFGSFDAYRQAAGFDSDSLAITVGADQRLGERGLVGMSLGYNHDNSDIGNDGTRNIAQGFSTAVYGSFLPSTHTYIDGVLGGGGLSFSSRRYDGDTGDQLLGRRNGNQWYAMLTGGYEYKWNDWLLSPYGSLQWSLSRLNPFSETGDVTGALSYGRELVRSSKTILGVRASGEIKESFGTLIPHFRFEFGHDFQGATSTTLSYAYIPSAGSWNVLTNPYAANGNSVQMGIGGDLQLNGNWLITTEYDYLVQPHSSDQMIRLGVKKQL